LKNESLGLRRWRGQEGFEGKKPRAICLDILNRVEETALHLIVFLPIHLNATDISIRSIALSSPN